MTEFSGMPPKVAAAVNDVMKAVKRLEKGEFNQHGQFKFTSIDDFLDASRPLCAEAGLVIIQDEEDFEVVTVKGDKDVSWLKLRFAFTLAHASGETWDRLIRRSIMVRADMGAQAFGAAQSYVEKQFLRSLFQMSTGDQEDADSHPQGNLPATRTNAAQRPPDGLKRLSSAQAKERGLDKDINDAIDGCTTRLELAEWDREFDKHTAQCPNAWLDAIRNRIVLRGEEIDREQGGADMDEEYRDIVGR